MLYVRRTVEAALHAALKRYPAVLLKGPRQCGKSTLAREKFAVSEGWTIADLERPRDVALVSSDVEKFLGEHPRQLIIDEAHRLPELFPALRYEIDRDRRNGRFLLLGSASPEIVRGVSETLAGRIGFVEMSPLLASEIAAAAQRRHARLRKFDRWFHGGFPSLLPLSSAQARHDWLENFVQTFIERDIPSLAPRLAPARVRLLWSMIAHVHGGLLNTSELARALSVSVHTVQHHLDILEGFFMIRRLPPYHANVGKRLTKSAKLYIRDSGILHFFAGLRRPAELDAWPKRGQSWEGHVIEELIATASLRPEKPEFFFWRTQAGAEVDLLMVVGRRIIPIEIKLGWTVGTQQLRGLRECMKDLDLKKGFVVTSGCEPRRSAGGGVVMISFADLIRDFGILFR
jgi:uncharacterized protein